MAEYFKTQKEAEEFIKKSPRTPVFFGRIINVHGKDQWMVDYDSRNYGSSIRIVENHSNRVHEVQRS